MDVLNQQIFTEERIVTMAQKLRGYAEKEGAEARECSFEDAKKILGQARLGGIGIPELVNRKVLGGEQDV